MPTTRQETDSLGTVQVPADRYWGAQTQRSINNFKISHDVLPREMIRALGLVKKACAQVNQELGRLDNSLANAIIQACDEVIAGDLDEHFPVKIWQTGSGTQSNMNANEVISNRANQLLGAELGSKRPVHPNDHVNLSQSSNDVFPSAMHIAVVERINQHLAPAVAALSRTLTTKAEAFNEVLKIGRTHLMDATPMSFGQEVGAWAAQLDLMLVAIAQSREHLLPLAQGGTAVGTGLNAPQGFAKNVSHRIAELTGIPFCPAVNSFAALSSHDALAHMSGTLRALAGALMKIANDVRWLASGPRCGLGEVRIPANEPGSSIMPGKVNPTQCEALTMVCAQVMGNDLAVGIAASQGNFQLNVFKPVIVFNVLNSVRLLGDCCASFDANCAQGLEPIPEQMTRNLERSLMLVTALTPRLGYDRAAKIAEQAHVTGKSLRQVAVENGELTDAEFDKLVQPRKLAKPYD